VSSPFMTGGGQPKCRPGYGLERKPTRDLAGLDSSAGDRARGVGAWSQPCFRAERGLWRTFGIWDHIELVQNSRA
jgi:hypothetical protein